MIRSAFGLRKSQTSDPGFPISNLKSEIAVSLTPTQSGYHHCFTPAIPLPTTVCSSNAAPENRSWVLSTNTTNPTPMTADNTKAINPPIRLKGLEPPNFLRIAVASFDNSCENYILKTAPDGKLLTTVSRNVSLDVRNGKKFPNPPA